MATNRIRLVAVALVVAVMLAATSGAASAPARGEGSSAPPPVERVSRELRNGAKSVIVFVSAGDKEYVATGGANRPTGSQRFRVGSVTKTFTATIVLELVEEGTLRLSSTLEDHVPGVIPRGDQITIRQLLQHRSGLANYPSQEYWSWLREAGRSPASTRPSDTLRFAASRPLQFEPGSRSGYSNTNYIALGLVIEKVTGHSYARELEQRILEPLGLDHTELPQTRRPPDLDDGGANPNVPWAAGGIVSNADDLSRYYSALLSGRILSSATLAAMKKTVEGVGLGIFSTDLPCGRFWGHPGGILDYQTLVSASEKGERIAVVSLRGPPGHLFVERALLCTEPPPAAGSAQASWKISFSSGPGPLYVMNADGSGQRWLTLTLSSWGPSPWSPDGRRIVFGSGRDGNGEVYVMNADGSAQRNLTHNPSHDFGPAWSPDGRRIAFVSQRDGNSEVYVMNADGSGQRNLTRSPRYEGGPAWSPDGRKIAFVSGSRSCRAGEGCAGHTDVYVMNADGSGQRRLTRAPMDDVVPAWSPDGRKIAFVSKRDGNAEIYVMNTDGSEQRNLTRSQADDGLVAWSPVRTK